MTRNSTLVRLGVDFGAPGAFLVSYLLTRDILAATWWLVGGSAVALLLGLVAEKRVAPLPLVAGGAAIIFGLLTVFLHDKIWIQMKPTFINLAFAAFLLGGVALKKSPLKLILGEVMKMPDPVWRTLAIRYGVFFLCVAILNEIVRQTQSEAFWVWFRMPGLQILALVFSATQFPTMLRGAKEMESANPDG